MLTYAEAERLIKTARDKRKGRKLENNTRLVERDGAFAVRLHETDVVTIFPDGSYRYDTGGWRTVTTKDRMNRYGSALIYSERGVWYIRPPLAADAKLYAEGVLTRPDGTIVGAAEPETKRAETKLRRRVGLYATAYAKALISGAVPPPSAGDCWFCALKTSDTRQPLGEVTKLHGDSHILSHIDERYYVPSLAWNAMNALGASQAAQQTVYFYQHGEPAKAYAKPGGFLFKQIEKMIRRYCLRELGLAY